MTEAQPVIVVGVDGSPGSAKALAWALEEARLRGWALRVLHAFPALVSYATGAVSHEYYPQVESEARELLDRVIAGVPGDHAVSVEPVLISGTPAGQLVEASKNARLLVVGSRGLGGFRGMLVGSVSIHCVRHAFCPVVVVRDDDEPGSG